MPGDPLDSSPTRSIGLLNEGSLHADLKRWYAQPGDRFEVSVDGFVIDIVRGDLLIEIQTGGFAAVKHKLRQLAADHPMRLIWPIAAQKWIVRPPTDGDLRPSRRKSPKRGTVEDLFVELVSFPELVLHDNFALEVLLTHEEESRHYDGQRAWRRRGWVSDGRSLLAVVGQSQFSTAADLAALLPDGLPDPFTTADLAAAMGRPRWLAQKMAYCLRRTGVIVATGHRSRSVAYVRSELAQESPVPGADGH